MDKEDIFHKTVLKHGVEAQVDQAIEECAELIKALVKWRRHKGSDSCFFDVIEEMADVELMLEQMERIFQRIFELHSGKPTQALHHGEDVRKAIDDWKVLKLKRLAESLES